MKHYTYKFLAFALIIAVIMLKGSVFAQDQKQGEKVPVTNVEKPEILPKLADIIPLASELTVRLAILESKIKEGLEAPIVEKKYGEIQARIDDLSSKYQRLKDSEDYKQNKLLDLNNAIKHESKSYKEASEPVRQAIQQLMVFKEDWLADKKKWNKWQEALIKERGFDQLSSSFVKANDTIDKGLNLIIPKLDELFRIQRKGANIDASLKILANNLEAHIEKERRRAVVKEVPPIISFRFFSQFISGETWTAIEDELYETSWPGSQFLNQQGWIIILQVFITIIVIITIYRKMEPLKASKRWQFLGKRYLSAGLFIGYMATVIIYENQGAPALFKQAFSIIGVITFARLMGGLIDISWKKQLIYGLMTVLVLSTLIEMLNLPLSFFRLYTLITSLTALIFCLLWSRENVRQQASKFLSWGLRLASLLFAIIVMAELWGKVLLSSYLFTSLLQSIAAVLFFMLFQHMIRGILELLLSLSPIRNATSSYLDIDVLVRRLGIFIDLAIWGLVLVPAILVIWGVYDSWEMAIRSMLGLGVNLGTLRITVGLLIIAIGFVYVSFLLSWVLQNLLLDRVLLRHGMERGVRVSIKRLIHYVLISLGFLFAISSLGFELTKLTILLSALGVGIGFGLQGVVNNFVSGLILLFERPIRVGDYIEINGNWCEVIKIGLRATSVQTFDQADVTIPNADLVANQVTNWTLRNRKNRLIISVGVAYGSDIPLVIENLKASAEQHAMVAKTPEPQVLFLKFGESSLDFELRVWVLDVDYRLKTQSELHQEIDRRFREAKIEIAFPQRDVHFHNVDDVVTLQPSSS